MTAFCLLTILFHRFGAVAQLDLRPKYAERNQGKETLKYEDGTGDKGDGFLERTLPNGQRFIVRHYAPHKADIIVVTSGHHYRMPDERIVEPDNEGDLTILEPGQTFKSYYFYLSPDEHWLFVARGGFRRFAVGYLYRRVSPTRMVPVHPHGRRIDDAALQLVARKEKLNARKLSGAARNVE